MLIPLILALQVVPSAGIAQPPATIFAEPAAMLIAVSISTPDERSEDSVRAARALNVSRTRSPTTGK